MGSPRNPLCQLIARSGCPGRYRQVLGAVLNRSESSRVLWAPCCDLSKCSTTNGAAGPRCAAGFRCGLCPLWVNRVRSIRCRRSRHVRFTSDSVCNRHRTQRSKIVVYSITSSARASRVGGISRPSALAAVRLMMRSNLVGCSTGMSAGFAPRRILSTKSATRRNWFEMFAP